jgi:hypothetical protein
MLPEIYLKLNEILKRKTKKYFLLAISIISFLLCILIMLPFIQDFIFRVIETNVLHRELRDVDRWRKYLFTFGYSFPPLALLFVAIIYVILNCQYFYQSVNKINKKIYFEIKNSKFIYFGTIFVALVFFIIIREVALTTHDDIAVYLLFRKYGFISVIKKSMGYSMRGGRLFQFTGGFTSYLPHIINNILIYKIVFYTYISFSVISLWYLLYAHLDKKIALLAVLLFFTFAQIDQQHNAFVSFAGYQLPIGFIFLSIERLCYYYKNGKKSSLLSSGILFIIPTILYETFIMFSLMLFIISIMHTYKKERKNMCIIDTLYDLRLHIILGAVYLILYFLGRLNSITTYSGATFKIINIKYSLMALIDYSTGLFPLNSFWRVVRHYDFWAYMDFLSIQKAIASSLVFIIIIKQINKIKIKKIAAVGGLAVLGVILPVTLICFTPYYVNSNINQGYYSTGNSYYSYFFIVVFLSIVCVLLYQTIKFKKILLFFLCVSVFSVSLFTDINNKFFANFFVSTLNRYRVFDKMVSSEYFLNIENGADIYAPDFIGIHNYMPSLNEAVPEGKHYNFTNNLNILNYDKPTYILKYDVNSKSMLTGLIDSDVRTDEIMIVSITPLESKSVVIIKDKSGILNIENCDDKIYNTTAIIPLGNIKADNLLLRGENIQILNCGLVLGNIEGGVDTDLIWTNGFSYLENNGFFNWRWCDKKGALEVNNLSGDLKIKLSGTFLTTHEEVSTISIKTDDFSENFTVNINGTYFEIDLHIKHGINTIEFLTEDTKQVYAPGDDRSMYFRIMNAKIDVIS